MQRSSSSSWPLIGPLQWSRYVNKQVKVVAGKDEEEWRGWLLTVDPVSASLVLVDFGAAGETSVQVVMGHAVEEVLVLKDPDQETLDRLWSCFLPPRTRILDPEQLRTRRDQVRVWLDQNRVPVEQHGEELRVAAVLTVRPPYGPEDCYSANQIILDRVQKLIRSQPDRPGPDPETEPEPESDPAPTG